MGGKRREVTWARRIIFGALAIGMALLSGARLGGLVPDSILLDLTFHLSTGALFFEGLLGLFFD